MSKVSVIIPVEREIEGFNRLIYSVLHQNYRDFEVIVVSNSCIINRFNDPRIIYIELQDKNSIPELLNAGIDYITSEFACFLHPDDLLLYNAVELRYRKFEENQYLTASYGLGIDTDTNYQVKCNQTYDFFFDDRAVIPRSSLESILSRDIRPTLSSLMIRTDILEKLRFNSDLKHSYIWDFFIRLFQSYDGRISQLEEAVYISKQEENEVKWHKKSYFMKSLKETFIVLDNFFMGENLEQNVLKHKCKIYKDNYSYLFAILAEYFTYNYWLRACLLFSYMKKNSELDNQLVDFWFLSILVNSLTATKSGVYKHYHKIVPVN